jgi:hypothetical protein
MGCFEHCGEDLQRGVEGMRRAGSIVQAVGNVVEFGLRVDGQIGALGQVLPQQPIGVLAGATLPRAVGVAEVHLHARAGGEITVARYLLALVVGQAVAHRLGNRIQLGRKARQRAGCRRIVHLGQQHQAAGALDEHTHEGLVAGTFDEVTLPVARHDAVLYLGRPHMDADHVGDRAAPVHTALARHACAATVAQAGDELAAQFAARVRVDGRVDRFVRDVHGRIIRPETFERAGNLLGRPLPVQHGQQGAPQDVIMMELGRRARLDSSRPAQRLRRQARVGPVTANVEGKLTADGPGRTPQRTGYGPHARTRLTQARNRHALLRLKLSVCRTGLHLCTLPEAGCWTSDLRPSGKLDGGKELIKVGHWVTVAALRYDVARVIFLEDHQSPR